MKKYILLISGSPRRGNTDFVLSRVYEKLDSKKEIVRLKDLNFKHCSGCLKCYSTGKCIFQDDMSKLFTKLFAADLIVIGSPLYYGNVSGLMKNFIDRTIPAYENGALKGKKIISIMVGGGEVSTTAGFHKEAIKGFVKYNKLNLIDTFSFQGWEKDDLKKNPESENKIDKITRKINSLLDDSKKYN